MRATRYTLSALRQSPNIYYHSYIGTRSLTMKSSLLSPRSIDCITVFPKNRYHEYSTVFFSFLFFRAPLRYCSRPLNQSTVDFYGDNATIHKHVRKSALRYLRKHVFTSCLSFWNSTPIAAEAGIIGRKVGYDKSRPPRRTSMSRVGGAGERGNSGFESNGAV